MGYIRDRALERKAERENDPRRQSIFKLIKANAQLNADRREYNKNAKKRLRHSIRDELRDRYAQAGVNPDKLIPRAVIGLNSRLRSAAIKLKNARNAVVSMTDLPGMIYGRSRWGDTYRSE